MPEATPLADGAGVVSRLDLLEHLTAEDIRRFGYRTVSDVLQSMAGVYTSNPRSYESVGIRGFGRRR